MCWASLDSIYNSNEPRRGGVLFGFMYNQTKSSLNYTHITSNSNGITFFFNTGFQIKDI